MATRTLLLLLRVSLVSACNLPTLLPADLAHRYQRQRNTVACLWARLQLCISLTLNNFSIRVDTSCQAQTQFKRPIPCTLQRLSMSIRTTTPDTASATTTTVPIPKLGLPAFLPTALCQSQLSLLLVGTLSHQTR